MRKRTARRERPLLVPKMGSINATHVSLTFYADLSAFISDPTATAYNRLMRSIELVAMAMYAQRISDYDVQIRSAKLAMRDVFGRYEATGNVTVLDLEAATLRAAAKSIEAAIGRTRLDVFCNAHTSLKLAMHVHGASVES